MVVSSLPEVFVGFVELARFNLPCARRVAVLLLKVGIMFAVRRAE